MLGLIYFWAGRAADEPNAPSDRETADVAPSEAEPTAELSWVTLNRLPADFRGPEGELIGTVFIDVELAVCGENEKIYLEENLSALRLAVLGSLARNGIGKADAPLEIDRERLADLLKGAANRALERPVIERVQVPEKISEP